ncbi:YtxH domain-containing protein [Desulfuromonas sp. AOP6]|uniref:YtxH domain-containing protein n=1 Tax=Desulfuromonas sp. AOP6 TaxID=1566351 RepID=UPI00127B6A46|nr:YtxH domain-containing protein [Desulfuromonas sp. AOP6]BCA79435.1 hypothetical protein AOP6_1222 [Desulfuromonas sp. AOP6]
MADDYRGCGAGSVFLAFVMGAAIGGGIALLTAPRSGSETRGKIRDLSDETLDRMKELTDEAEGRLKGVVDEGRELLNEKKDLIQAAIEAGKQAMEAEKAKKKEA